MRDKVKVMIVDDTITYRQILSRVAEELPKVELVGTATSGKTALMKIPSLKPDLVFLDVMMPEMDGIETLREIKKISTKIQVVMVSAFDMENARVTLESLRDGALDFVAKPSATNMQEGIAKLKEALSPIVDIVAERLFPAMKAQKPPVPPPTPKRTIPKIPTPPPQKMGKIDLILLGISTGGPNALYELFSNLQTKLPCPVLIVQHMPPMFTKSLADRLSSISPMKIQEAEEGVPIRSGEVYIAPGGKHMILRNRGNALKISITDGPPVNHCKPAVDVLFQSVAVLNGVNPLCVIMTGMGRDGTKGVQALKRKGTRCLIQDKSSSVVWGMPGSIQEAGLADEVLPLSRLAGRILELSK